MSEKKMAEKFQLKEDVTVEGVTSDFVWYESEGLLRSMQSWESRLKKLVSVMEARHKEHIKMLEDVMRENDELKFEISDLKSQLEEKK